MPTADVTLDPAFVIAPVPKRLFGSLVEHMGRCVYGGVYEPEHPSADANGFRTDVLDLTRELGITMARYPGGNIVSSFEWEDSVGPVADRPTRLDLAWRQLEPNTFGLNEFMTWARTAQVEPMLVVNMGTRGIADACNLLEYTNFSRGTKYSDMRIKHGVEDPYGVRLWSLGNEQDGDWQVGQKTATEYGLLAAETAKAMRKIDPTIEIVACASAWRELPTKGSWQAETLEHAYDHVDYVSLHSYFEPVDGDRLGFLGSPTIVDKLIEDAIATADYVGAKKRSTKKLNIAYDEWNVWYESRFVETNASWAWESDVASGAWRIAPRLMEDTYTVQDAVVVGNMLMTLLRHADRVTIGCQSELVNVIGLIRSEPSTPAWRQSAFHPFALMARHARGDVLRTAIRTGTLDSPTIGDIPETDVVATCNPEDSTVAVFAVNRNLNESVTLRLHLPGTGPCTVVEHVEIGGCEHTDETNTEHAPDTVTPRRSTAHTVHGDRLDVVLPASSWSMVRIAPVRT